MRSRVRTRTHGSGVPRAHSAMKWDFKVEFVCNYTVDGGRPSEFGLQE